MKVTEWASDRKKDAFEKVAQDEAKKKLSIVQDIMIRSTEYLRRIIAPAGEDKEALQCHTCARIVTVSIWKITFGGSLGEKGVAIGGARFVEKSTTGSNQTGSWCCKQVKVLMRPRSSERMQYTRAFCGNLINALKLLANQHEDGDALIQNIVTNLGEGSREGLTNGLGEFKQSDNRRALEVGYLNKGMGFFLKVRRFESSRRMPRGDGQGEPR